MIDGQWFYVHLYFIAKSNGLLSNNHELLKCLANSFEIHSPVSSFHSICGYKLFNHSVILCQVSRKTLKLVGFECLGCDQGCRTWATDYCPYISALWHSLQRRAFTWPYNRSRRLDTPVRDPSASAVSLAPWLTAVAIRQLSARPCHEEWRCCV